MSSYSLPTYTSNTDVIDYWMKTIAPKYFDMKDMNTYTSGTFGYINAVMSEAIMDSQLATNVMRREVYASCAKYMKSLYKAAILHDVDIPVSIPCHVDMQILVLEDHIINSGTRLANGMVQYVVDNTMVANVDGIPFTLDYPIIILAKKVGTVWNYTAHYDITYESSVSAISNKYLLTKRMYNGGTWALVMRVNLTQVSRDTKEEPVIRNSVLETITVDFPFDGDLAGFDAFYIENDNSPAIQLKTQVDGSPAVSTPFCNYTFLNDNTIRLIFPYNNFFMPAFNSKIRIQIYTSLGSKGTFKYYNGDVAIEFNSEDYPYNNESRMVGRIYGGTVGGGDAKDIEEFRKDIIHASSTNRTYVTENDLQIQFNDRVGSDLNRINFYKMRDDYKNRIFGAFMLMKDENEFIIPSNSLDLNIKKSDFDSYYPSTLRMVLKAGNIFTYEHDDIETFTIKKDMERKLTDNLDEYEMPGTGKELNLFTNPFLICATVNPTVLGCYLNSADEVVPLSYETVNDSSFMQFNISYLGYSRNAVLGENYYKLSLDIMPSSTMDPLELIDIPENPEVLRARRDGVVISKLMNDEKDVVMTVRYSNNETEDFILNSKVDIGDGVDENDEPIKTFTYKTGYYTELNVGDEFVKDNILCTQRVTDKGRLRLMALIDHKNVDIKDFIIFTIENYDAETDHYIANAYLKTDDYVTLAENVEVSGHIYDKNLEVANDIVPVPIEELRLNVACLYKDDSTNKSHKYSDYDYAYGYTLTNTYSQAEDSYITLLKPLKYVRCKMTFSELPKEEPEVPSNLFLAGLERNTTAGTCTAPDDFMVTIKGLPVLKSNWIKVPDNFSKFIEVFKKNVEWVDSIFYTLEQTFGIDIKLYNTYGRSRYYSVGIKDESWSLDTVNCTFSFGIKLNTLTTQETFRDKFILYLKDYVESINVTASNVPVSIYIFNMTTDIKNNFPEIDYLEYYGMNDYQYDVQKIESPSIQEIKALGNADYVPEFVNLKTYTLEKETYLSVNITFL